MQRDDFGKLCASLRRDFFNILENRYWSQEDLAKASNLSVRIIGNIEQGKKASLDSEVLSNLAEAFCLTTIERQRFFALAHSTNEIHDTIQLKHVTQDLETLQQPILLHDGLYKILKVNTAFLKIYGLTTEYLDSIPDDDPTKFHIVRHIHDSKSPIRKVYQTQIKSIELNNQIHWRYFSLAHRHKELFRSLQDELFEKCPEFSYAWRNLSYRLAQTDLINLKRCYNSLHPELGCLKYTGITSNISYADNEVFLVSLIPQDTRTHSIFDSLTKSPYFRLIDCTNLNRSNG